MTFTIWGKYTINPWKTPKILEKIVSVETLPNWTKRDRKSTK